MSFQEVSVPATIVQAKSVANIKVALTTPITKFGAVKIAHTSRSASLPIEVVLSGRTAIVSKDGKETVNVILQFINPSDLPVSVPAFRCHIDVEEVEGPTTTTTTTTTATSEKPATITTPAASTKEKAGK